MSYNRFGSSDQEELPPFDELNQETLYAFMRIGLGVRDKRIADAIIADETAKGIVQEAYESLPNQPSREEQQDFIAQLESRVRELSDRTSGS